MTEGEGFSQLVVVGSSAGGVEALSTLVSTLPATFPAPIVIAQHLDPNRASHLGAILNERSTLPVRTVDDCEVLEPGVVYVVPANRNVRITNHEVGLETSQRGPKPSIDLLLTSAAAIFGDNLIAVILTGTGSDGAAGALEVKRAGGTVVIQNPRTALYPALPLSLSPAAVDVVAEIEEIGPLLYSLLTAPAAPVSAGDEAAIGSLLQQLQERFAVDFTSYKQPTIRRRLMRRVVATGNDSIQSYVQYLGAHPEEYRSLISSYLIKVTEFFRDPELYDYLRETVLPAIIAGARRRGNELRIWSAGCATGEEAYSLAILLANLLEDEHERFTVRIFGTDLDPDAIEFARRGVYPEAAVRNVPEDLLSKYFTPLGNEYQVSKVVRGLLIFGEHDLAERAPFPRIDLLVCRNVLIYFGTELQHHVLQLFAFSLRDAGYLVLGKAETITALADLFVLDNPRLKVFRRRGERTLFPPSRARETRRIVLPPRIPSTPVARGGTMPGGRFSHEERTGALTHERWSQVLLQLPVGVVIVNRDYDIQIINGAARQLLGIYAPAIGTDFVHLVQSVPSRPLRAAIDRCLQGEAVPPLEDVAVSEVPGGEERYLQIGFHPYQPTRDQQPDTYVMVVIEDVTEQVRQRGAAELVREQQAEEVARVRAQLAELTAINQELRQANEDLTIVNMELRSSNEEFLVGNEELQAAAEEVETLNEELQATNEELETLNEELQSTVEELNATNDDLQARSVELQELSVSMEAARRASETERARLHTILRGMGDAVLVVDRDGKAILTNPAFTRLFGEDIGDLAALDGNGQPLSGETSPQARVARGEAFSVEFSAPGPDGSRRSFEANGHPIGSDGELEGGVLVIRDITERSLNRP